MIPHRSMHPTDDFTVEVQRHPGAAVVSPAGEIDVATVDQLRERLLACEADSPMVVLDLRRVEFMDTSGLQLVFECQRRAQAGGPAFALVRGSRQIERLFEIAGFGPGLRVLDDPAEVTGEGA
jgi:stage II sporulation protein AA (anti-sigma F factor antagonist)